VPPNQSVKTPERIFQPWPTRYPKPQQTEGHPSRRFLYHDFCSRSTGHRGWTSLTSPPMLGENPESASVAFAITS
jgi:hypothetical protein